MTERRKTWCANALAVFLTLGLLNAATAQPASPLAEASGPLQVLLRHDWRLQQILPGKQGQGALDLPADVRLLPIVHVKPHDAQMLKVFTVLCSGAGGMYRIDGQRLRIVDILLSTQRLCPDKPGVDELELNMQQQLYKLGAFRISDGPRPLLVLGFSDGSAWRLTGSLTKDARYGPPTNVVLEVAPETVPCTGSNGAAQCLKVRRLATTGGKCPPPLEDWQVYAGEIEGFQFEPASKHVLEIKRYTDAQAPVGKQHVDVMVGASSTLMGDLNRLFGTQGKPFNFDPCGPGLR